MAIHNFLNRVIPIRFNNLLKLYVNIISDEYHDRFLIIYDKQVYHIGVSLKDLGKKV